MALPDVRPPDDGFLDEVHVYERHVVGLPRLGAYFRELWSRRQFAFELSRTTLRGQHFDTTFGMLWLVINPLLLGAVYFLLVDIISSRDRGPSFFAHLLANLFAFYFINHSLSEGVNSVVGGGRLILNTAFPRLLMPVSAVLTAFLKFLPTLIVYALVHLIAGLPLGPHLLWVFPVLAELICFALGVAMLFGTAQVYFRDTKPFLPYLLRIWLYLSPVLYYVEDIPHALRGVIRFNPLYSMLGAWSEVLIEGKRPAWHLLGEGALWAGGALLVGLLVFLSRERDFAVRI